MGTLLLAVLATGCQLSLDVGVTVDRDGSGRLELRVAADEALVEQTRAAEAAPLDILTDRREDLEAAGWEVTETAPPDGGRAVELASAFADPGAFEALTADLAGALAGPELRLLEPFELTVTDDRVVLEGRASLVPTDAVAELGLSREEAIAWLSGEQGAPDGAADAGMSYQVTATLPGEIVATTATQRNGRTLSWSVPPGEEVGIRAVSRRPEPPRWPLWAGALAGAAAAGAGLGVWRFRARSRASTR